MDYTAVLALAAGEVLLGLRALGAIPGVRKLTVAYSGGTEFNFVNDVPHFDTYLASERKFAAIAAVAGTTMVMGDQSQFDSAAPKLRTLADRRPVKAHPLDVGAAAVVRYFKIEDQKQVREHVEAGAAIFSDDLKSYDGLGDDYQHAVINHAVEYVNGNVHTNGMENFWSC